MESALAVIEKMSPAEIFKPGTMDPILDRIKSEVRSVKTDISTEQGRKDIASLAYKVAKSKTFLDGVRKQLVEGEKKRLKAIDAEGSRIWDELEALQKEVRKPLTDWEDAEKERVARHELNLMSIAMLGIVALDTSIHEIKASIAELDHIDLSTFQEFKDRASDQKLLSMDVLTHTLARMEKEESDRIELARLRAEQAKRDQEERERDIAQRARENAEREAKEREDRQARAAETERKRIEAEKFEAEARAKQLEEQRKADALRVERERKEAAERAEKEKLLAVELERRRAAETQERLKQEGETRERNKKHVAKINCEVRGAFISEGLTIDEATHVVQAIAKGAIPHTKISY
jgi:hypothetical protein